MKRFHDNDVTALNFLHLSTFWAATLFNFWWLSHHLLCSLVLVQLASLFSVHGCYHHLKNNSSSGFNSSEDMEQGLYVPLAHEVNKNGVNLVNKLDHPGKLHAVLTSGFWDNMFQVLYQVMFCLVERTIQLPNFALEYCMPAIKWMCVMVVSNLPPRDFFVLCF